MWLASATQLCTGSWKRASEYRIDGPLQLPDESADHAELMKAQRRRAIEAFETGLGTAKRVNEWGEVVERYP
jgi:hypothetical protein